MNLFIVIIIYCLLVFIHVGIFYAINLYDNYYDEELACITAAIIFPLIWAVLLIGAVASIPFKIVDKVKERSCQG